MVNFAQLRAFVAVAETGSLTAAATELEITQSAVSHALASLERELDARLVERLRAGSTVTELGESLLPHAREAVRAVDRFVGEASAALGRNDSLRIAVFPSAAPLLAPLLPELRRAHCGLRVTVLEGSDQEVEDWLSAGVVELGTITALEPGRIGTALAEDSMLAVLPVDHPLAAEAEIEVADLEDDEFLLSTGGCEPLIRHIFRSASAELTATHRVRDMTTLLSMVAENLGVTIAPSLALCGSDGATVLRRDIAAVPLAPRVTRTLVLAARPGATLSPTARCLLDLAAARGPGVVEPVQAGTGSRPAPSKGR